jgi:hypothetical protein
MSQKFLEEVPEGQSVQVQDISDTGHYGESDEAPPRRQERRNITEKNDDVE